MRDILGRWRSHFHLSNIFVWPAAPFFAGGLAHGRIGYDVSIVLGKNRRGGWMALVQPSRRVRQELLAEGKAACVHYHEARMQVTKRPRLEGHGVARQPFTATELIATVRQAKNLKSQDQARQNARDVLANPLTGAVALGLDIEAISSRQPAGTSLRQARGRLDMAAMLWQREMYVAHGPFSAISRATLRPSFPSRSRSS